MRLFNVMFIAVLGVASYFLFNSGPLPLEHAGLGVKDLNRQPAMIPGVEAVRPPAAGQNRVTQDLMSELVIPPPPKVPSSRPRGNYRVPMNYSGVIKILSHEATVNEFSVYSEGEKKLTRIEFYDPRSGALLVKSLERFHDNRLKRKIDEVYGSDGNLIKKYATLFDEDGRILRKEVDLDLDGRPDQTVDF